MVWCGEGSGLSVAFRAKPAVAAADPPLVQPADIAHRVRIHVETRPDDWRMWMLAAGVEGVDPVAGPVFQSIPVAVEAALGGVGMVIADRRAASVTASAWRASAGALSRLPVAKVNNIARSLNRLKKADYLVLGLSTHSGTPINNLQGEFLDRPIALVVGSESTGMSRLVAESCDVLTNIEIARSTESLNASVATGIALNVIRSA